MVRRVIALAGRRPDAPQATSSSFALADVPAVTSRLRALFQALAPSTLVSSAACGADLLALQVAGDLRIRRRVVLPFDAERFRESSVEDRPDERWAPLYDRIIREVRADNNLVTLAPHGDPNAAYSQANAAILDEAQAIAGADGETVAVLVWEGPRASGDDLTRDFATEAQHRGVRIESVSTRPNSATAPISKR